MIIPSVSDIIAGCDLVIKLMSTYMSADSDLAFYLEFFQTLKDMVTLRSAHVDQYVLPFATEQTWFNCLKVCDHQIQELRQILEQHGARMNVLQKMKYAWFKNLRIRKRIDKLEVQVAFIGSFEHVVIRDGVRGKSLEGLKSLEH